MYQNVENKTYNYSLRTAHWLNLIKANTWFPFHWLEFQFVCLLLSLCVTATIAVPVQLPLWSICHRIFNYLRIVLAISVDIWWLWFSICMHSSNANTLMSRSSTVFWRFYFNFKNSNSSHYCFWFYLSHLNVSAFGCFVWFAYFLLIITIKCDKCVARAHFRLSD